MERWFRSLRTELTDRTLIWNIPHLMRLLREHETFYNHHRPHRALGQAALMRPLPVIVTDLDAFRVSRRDRAGGLLHEYRHVAYFSAPHRQWVDALRWGLWPAGWIAGSWTAAGPGGTC
jgi:transposase InsO family protein